jgi:hypothetical protein
MRKKFPGATIAQIKTAVKQAGPGRAAVEKKLKTLLHDRASCMLAL